MPERSGFPLPMLARIAAALLGGYVFVWGMASLIIVAQVAAGVGFHEAEHGAMLLAFLVYLGVFLWAFAAQRLLLVWVVLAGGGGLMTAAAWAVQQSLIN